MISSQWNPKQYLKFKSERTQPAMDLLNRIKIDAPANIIDIGCGPGNSTALLKNRYPNSNVIGADSSAEMLKKAAADYHDINFELCDASCDLVRYSGQFDIVFSNACIQWIPNHKKLIPEMFAMLKSGGTLAVQQPMNYDEPIQRIIREVASNNYWSKKLALRNIDILTKAEYYDLFGSISDSFDMWEVVYYHSLPGYDAVVEWYRGTGMRPYLAQLNDEEKLMYEQDVLNEVKKQYTLQADGSLMFRFPRLFFTINKA